MPECSPSLRRSTSRSDRPAKPSARLASRSLSKTRWATTAAAFSASAFSPPSQQIAVTWSAPVGYGSAIESDRVGAPLGGWLRHREASAARIAKLESNDFQRALAAGRELSLRDGVQLALSP
jgi:hypothetical protein